MGILLVGPKNQKIVLMADSCGLGVANLTLTFSDYAATGFTEYPAGPIVSGTYQPSDCGSGDNTFPAGAPAGPYATALSICDGSSPNGVWSLYVQDDNGTDLADGGRYSGATTPNLVIANTLTSDSGSQISCVVSNSFGSAASSKALLTVHSSTTPWFSAFTKLPNGQVQWTLSGAPMSNYTILFSSDLKTWKTLTTVTTTNGSVTVIDPTTGLKQRFYRAVLAP